MPKVASLAIKYREKLCRHVQGNKAMAADTYRLIFLLKGDQLINKKAVYCMCEIIGVRVRTVSLKGDQLINKKAVYCMCEIIGVRVRTVR